MFTELKKILQSDKPSQDISEILIFFPELIDLKGVEERNGQRHKDMFIHTLIVLDNVARVSEKLELRYAALLHDIGKSKTKRFEKETGWTFHGHEYVGAKMIVEIGKRLAIPEGLTKYAKRIAELHHRPIDAAKKGVTDSAVRRVMTDADDILEDLLLFCRCDVTTRHPHKRQRCMNNFDFLEKRIKEVIEKDEAAKFQSPVRGNEIMKICGLKPGPEVGRLKKAIEDAILAGDIQNEYDAARTYLLKLHEG